MSWRGTSTSTSPRLLADTLLAWDGEAQVLLFDEATGDTHLLSALAGLLLELLEQGTRDFQELLEAVRAALAETPPDLPALLTEHLQHLTRLGLLQEDGRLKVSDLDVATLRRRLRLRGPGLRLTMPPFSACIRSDVPRLADEIAAMYADFELAPDDGFCDFHVEVLRAGGLRRWFKPQAEFAVDGKRSFVPLPAAQCFTMLEWGLNWCVAAHAHQHLLIHAAVLERDGRAALLPAPPGSGKSTLCAGLVHRGWRLLSDELALLDMDTGLLAGMARPVNLKNGSIGVIGAFEQSAQLTAAVPNTNKGTVALMRPPMAAVQRVREPARAAWIILPRYAAGAPALFTPLEKAPTFMAVAEQSFNYDLQALRGFRALGRLVDQCQTLQFAYSRLEDAAAQFDRLAEGSLP